MRRISACLLSAGLLAGLFPAGAQVLAPQEIKDPAARALQQKYLAELKSVGTDLRSHKFPYSFYFSRTLDLDEEQQRRFDQRSIRFDKYEGQTVLEITGNYYAAYSGELMNPGQRVRQTFFDVMLPMLGAAVPRFAGNDSFQSYALEISHHVRRKVMGLSAEKPENVVLIVPREAAQRLVAAKTPEQQQEALEEAEMFLDAEPFALSLAGKPSSTTVKSRKEEAVGPAAAPAPAPAPSVSPRLLKIPELPARAVTPETLAALESTHRETLARLVQKLEPQAHFVSYAPPAFISFHQGAWLQLSLTTMLDSSAGGSRYKLAALAFDEHISHLVRPVVAYFSQDPGFEGVDFSATVRAGAGSLSVEFYFPFPALRCFAQYDCTGQQFIDAGIVLINGERVGLDLQKAEASTLPFVTNVTDPKSLRDHR